MQEVIDQLQRQDVINDADRQRIESALAQGQLLDEALIAAGQISESKALEALSTVFHWPMADLETQKPTREFLAAFPARMLLQHMLLPLSQDGNVIQIATARPFNNTGFDVLRLATGKDYVPVLAPREDIERILKELLGVGADTMQSLVSDADASGVEIIKEGDGEADLESAAEDASIIRFVNQILSEAIELRATDVHFEPFEQRFRVRYRVDGVLVEASIPAEVGRFRAAMVSRIKILSQLDIAEKRVPQDGRIKLKVGLHEVDVRVSIIPMLHGEAVVLRLLDRNAPLLGLERLGMAGSDRDHFERVLNLPHGIVLVTGPTGSGKTTSLYAGLSRINKVDRKIITIEDPIEYHLEGINQIQVATKAGLTFASGLRAILRHDPDVVLIGEIRDRETAEIAVQASLTGHLVFSTLHTNDAPGAVTRLVDMGIEPYLVASSLELVVAQRLVRLICSKCRMTLAPSDLEAQELQAEFGDQAPEVIYRGAGCRQCRNTGFKGRNGIFEVMPVTDSVRSLMLTHAPASELRAAAAIHGMRNLRDDGRRLVLEGRTTLEEVLRMTKEEPTVKITNQPTTSQSHATPAVNHVNHAKQNSMTDAKST